MKLCQNTLSDLGIKGGFTQLGLHSLVKLYLLATSIFICISNAENDEFVLPIIES